jgi:hypothetical protein
MDVFSLITWCRNSLSLESVDKRRFQLHTDLPSIQDISRSFVTMTLYKVV